MIRNQKGFTLIEIIAVLVILGILAAVAVPKYLSMADEARIKSAQAAVAEIKGRLSSSQAKYMMLNGGSVPSATQLLDYANLQYTPAGQLGNVGGDYTIVAPAVVTVAGVSGISINVTNVQSAACGNYDVGRCAGFFAPASAVTP